MNPTTDTMQGPPWRDFDIRERQKPTLTASTDFPGNASNFGTMMQSLHHLAVVMVVAGLAIAVLMI